MMDRRGLEAMACRHHADGLWWMPPPPAAPPPVALRDSDQKRARHAPHTRPAQKVGTRVRDGTGAILLGKKAERGERHGGGGGWEEKAAAAEWQRWRRSHLCVRGGRGVQWCTVPDASSE